MFTVYARNATKNVSIIVAKNLLTKDSATDVQIRWNYERPELEILIYENNKFVSKLTGGDAKIQQQKLVEQAITKL